MTEPEPRPIVADATSGLVRNATRQEAAEMEVAPLGKPNRRTVSQIWLGIVYTAIAVMAISGGGLVAGMFLTDYPSLVKPEAVLILFSTSSAFLMGLIARDPGQHN